MTRVGSQCHSKKKKIHLVGYFHNCITMHGFMNIKSVFLITEFSKSDFGGSHHFIQDSI